MQALKGEGGVGAGGSNCGCSRSGRSAAQEVVATFECVERPIYTQTLQPLFEMRSRSESGAKGGEKPVSVTVTREETHQKQYSGCCIWDVQA